MVNFHKKHPKVSVLINIHLKSDSALYFDNHMLTLFLLIGYFLTKIFHPNVAVPSGEICVNTLKKDWNPSNWSLSHIFEVIKCLLIVPFPESSLNEEAGRQFMESYDDFFRNAKVYTQVHARPSV